ncbi:MAG: ABC transporter ATP-binding protein [Bifidobacteriaceae bacterium]|nr:ABC transporter ATP-binding protein [Bifidobacteriaceae bacterium]
MGSIEIKAVSRVFEAGGGREVRAVDGVSFTVDDGRFTVVLGPSGSGKTTILNLLGGMDSPTSGRISVDGADLASASDGQLTAYRRDQVGFVFQFYNLISSLTAAENVALGSQFATDPTPPTEALGRVGLEARAGSFPYQLSGGEMQRVAIARAVAKRPRLLLCDEPTGALDSDTGMAVFSLLRSLAGEAGRAVVVVTHNEALAQAADRVVRLRDGRVVSLEDNPAPAPVAELAR